LRTAGLAAATGPASSTDDSVAESRDTGGARPTTAARSAIRPFTTVSAILSAFASQPTAGHSAGTTPATRPSQPAFGRAESAGARYPGISTDPATRARRHSDGGGIDRRAARDPDVICNMDLRRSPPNEPDLRSRDHQITGHIETRNAVRIVHIGKETRAEELRITFVIANYAAVVGINGHGLSTSGEIRQMIGHRSEE
jgi:hypothetical protein